MGCFLISFCLGNTFLPFGDGLSHDVQLDGQLFLGQPFGLAKMLQILTQHEPTPFPTTYHNYRAKPPVASSNGI